MAKSIGGLEVHENKTNRTYNDMYDTLCFYYGKQLKIINTYKVFVEHFVPVFIKYCKYSEKIKDIKFWFTTVNEEIIHIIYGKVFSYKRLFALPITDNMIYPYTHYIEDYDEVAYEKRIREYNSIHEASSKIAFLKEKMEQKNNEYRSCMKELINSLLSEN